MDNNRIITINDKKYKEENLSNEIKTSLISLSTHKTSKTRLQIDIENCDILIKHHGKIVDDELVKIKPIEEDIVAEDKTYENGKS